MPTRREFGLGLGATALGMTVRARSSQAAAILMRMGNAAGVNDPQLSFMTVGQHPKLGYYQAEGLNVSIVNMSSSSQSLQAIATGNAEFGTLSPPTYLPIVASNPSLNIVSAYVWLPQVHYAVAVKPDAPVKAIAELKGKRIGIRNKGDSGYFAMQAMLEELGMDPAHEVEWISVGGGGPAGAALYHDRIDAIAIWDAELARIELAGFKLRYLENTPGMRKLFGSAFGVSRSGLEADRRRYVGLFRAMAKSTVFTRANPELAIRLHWQLYPESKPKGKSEAEALKDASYILKVRMDKWFAGPWQADKRMGASSLEAWQAQLRYTHLEDKIKDASVLFTNELIDDVNRFDRAAIERNAREMTL